jgi:uncharacterized membrane protein YuzA (DUF378 family)
MGRDLSRLRLWIIAPTLVLYFWSAQEAYLWLSPQSDEEISVGVAFFKAAKLFVYLLAVITQAFLARACTDRNLTTSDSLSMWARTVAVVVGIYALYNLMSWIRKRISPRDSDFANPNLSSFGEYFWFYVVFAGIFVIAALLKSCFSGALYGPGVCLCFLIYFASYVMLWRKWFLLALSPAKKPAAS